MVIICDNQMVQKKAFWFKKSGDTLDLPYIAAFKNRSEEDSTRSRNEQIDLFGKKYGSVEKVGKLCTVHPF